MLREEGPPSGSVEQQDAEVVPAQVDAGLQSARARTNDYTVKEFPAAYAACLFQSPSFSETVKREWPITANPLQTAPQNYHKQGCLRGIPVYDCEPLSGSNPYRDT
jgi:hypothetical protein